jgi:hypothetical protein
MLFSTSASAALRNLNAGSLNDPFPQTNATNATALSSSELMAPVQQNNLLRSSGNWTTTTGVINKVYKGTNLDPTTVDRQPYAQNPALDDTFAGAYSLFTLTDSGSRSDNIGKDTDGVDYTHFRLEKTSAFNLQLHGVQGNALVELLDSAGNSIAHSRSFENLATSDPVSGIQVTSNYDTHDISLNLSSLGSGDYYIKVSPSRRLPSTLTEGLRRVEWVETDYTLTASTDTVNNLLPAEVDLGNLSETRLLNGTVSDTNTSDIYRLTFNNSSDLHVTLSGMEANADIRLIRDYNNNGIVDSQDVLAGSYQSGGNADGIDVSLSGGTSYFVQVNRAAAEAGKTINYNLGISTGDWYTQNLSDFGIIANVRLSAKDGVLDRQDMLSLLRETKDFGSIDGAEITDLRTILSNLGDLMPEHVRVLSNKVINGNPANTKVTPFGNLVATSSSDQMENLIGKWFLGSDRPVALSSDKTTTYEYKPVQGQLFRDGIVYSDITQGDVGDCYFLASLAATTLKTRDVIQNMFIDNGDNTFTVRFFMNGKTDYVTVDRSLPTNSSGGAAFAGWGGGHFSNTNNELWVALAEKAYAQINESGGIGQDGTNSYNGRDVSPTPVKDNRDGGINGGTGNDALAHITGRSTKKGNVNWGIFDQNDDIGRIIHAFNTNQLVVLGTNKADEVASEFVGKHAYALVAAQPDGFVVYNPWGFSGDTGKDGQFKPGLFAISKDQMMDNFKSWYATTA